MANSTSFSDFIRGKNPYTKDEKQKIMMDVIDAACERQIKTCEQAQLCKNINKEEN